MQPCTLLFCERPYSLEVNFGTFCPTFGIREVIADPGCHHLPCSNLFLDLEEKTNHLLKLLMRCCHIVLQKRLIFLRKCMFTKSYEKDDVSLVLTNTRSLKGLGLDHPIGELQHISCFLQRNRENCDLITIFYQLACALNTIHVH